MASAHSLLGLVNQLQSMEQHFTSLLLETILKLTALTDAKVLVLVESPDGRRVAGSEHLCRAFADGLLQPRLSDRLVHLQPEVYALREEPLAAAPSDSQAEMDVRVLSVHSAPGGERGDVLGGSPNSLGRKRGPPAGFSRRPRPPKEKRLTPPHLKRDPDWGAFQAAEFPAPAASFSLDPPADYGAGNGVGAPDEGAGGVDGAASDSYDGVAYDANGGGGEEGGEDGGDGPVEDDSFAEVLFSRPISLNGSASCLAASSPAIEDGSGSAPPIASDGGALVPAFQHDLAFIEEFMRTNHKVGPVLSIYDDAVTEKNSVSNKVTLSLVYDFAKCLYAHSPYASFKDWGFREYFEAAFDQFWHNFPNFAVWEASHMRFQERVDKRTNMCRMATPKSFLRQKIRINVINLMLAKHKLANANAAAIKSPKKALPLP